MTEQSHIQENPIVGESPKIYENPKNSLVDSDVFHHKFAGFWTRFWAYTIDLIVLYAISGIFIKPIYRAADLAISNPVFLFFSPYKITILIVFLLYFTLMTKFFQQTIGKMVMGVKVVSQTGERLTWSALIFREVIGRFISKLLLLPYLLIVFMPKKEALHDIFADTIVVHENAYEKNSQTRDSTNVRREQLPEAPVV